MDLIKIKHDGKQIFNFFVIKLLFIMFVIEFVKGALLITILPVYMGSILGLSASIIGLSLSLQYVGDDVFRLPVGWIIDRIGYRWSMFFGVLLALLSVVLIALSTHFIWIVLASTLLGIGTAPLWPAVVTGTTEVAGDRARGTIMSVVYMAWLSGVGLGPIVINFFIVDTYDSAFRVLIMLMITVVITAFLLPGHLTKNSEKKIQSKSKFAFNTQNLNEIKLSRVEKVKRYFSEAKKSLNISGLFLFAMFLETFSLGLLIPVITLYVRTQLHFSSTEYSLLLFSGSAISVVLLIPVGKLIDKWGTSWFLHIGFMLNAFTLSMFTYVHTKDMIYITVALIGFGFALIIPSWNALVASAIPSEKRGAIWGFFLTISGSGMILGPIVSGMLWDQLGPHSPFITSGLTLFVLFILHLFISLEKKIVVR